MKADLSSEDLDDTLRIAKEAAHKAGKNALRYFGRKQTLKRKTGSKDELTRVDIENNSLIVRLLRKNFPDHSILSEEAQPPLKIKKYFWLVDPLDGTISYSFGLPYWGVAISLIYDNDPILGVIYLPVLDKLYWAVKGKGAYVNGMRLTVSDISSLAKGVIAIDYGYATERETGVEEIT